MTWHAGLAGSEERALATREVAPYGLTLTEAGRTVLARVTGPLDEEAAPRFLRALQPLAQDGRRIVVDLLQTHFVDSGGVRALLALQDRLDGAGGELRLVAGTGGRVYRTLSLLRLHERFRIFHNLSEAWSHRTHA